MRNLHLGRSIFGDLPTQQMAQKGLPILVSKAQKGETILLRELAQEIAPHLTQINWTMRWVFCWIHTTLYELERQDNWEYGEIPGLTAIALILIVILNVGVNLQSLLFELKLLSFTNE